MVNDRVQVSGVTAIMIINEKLANVMVEKNSVFEIYLEESYPLETLYDRSLPHGLIFKVGHKKIEKLPQSAIQTDHKFWTGECKSLIGNSIVEGTSVAELCAWTEKVFLDPNALVFKGNRDYVTDAQAPQYWSQCRSAIAAYYEWWSKNSEKSQAEILLKEADFAYRQSVGLSPYNTMVVWRYADSYFRISGRMMRGGSLTRR